MQNTAPGSVAHMPGAARLRFVAARGFSLIEVILAMAILAGAIVILGELMRFGLRNAELVRDTTRAQLLCESKLAEIVSQAAVLEPVSETVLETDADWMYSVVVNSTDLEGLVAVEVTVYPANRRTAANEFRLVRWMQDPAAVVAAEEAAAAAAEGTVTTP